jgi:hypothetical protein
LFWLNSSTSQGRRAVTEGSNLDAALELAAAGLPVFPVRITHNPVTLRFNKQPCIGGWQTRATTDEVAIREFWHLFPYAVPGLALGQASLVVLDADRHGGPDGVSAFRDLAAHHGLPEGVVRINTAGSGEHWVFRNLADDPLGNGEGVLPGGINIRGHGGFIVAPQGPYVLTGNTGASRMMGSVLPRPLRLKLSRRSRSGS